MKKVTVREVVAAIRKNGYPKAVGEYWNGDRTKGCALGQAARNLGVEAYALDETLGHAVNDLTPRVEDQFFFERLVSLSTYVVRVNDRTEKSLPEIADNLEEILTEEQLSREFSVPERLW